MAGDYILALDQGTTNTKAILVDKAGKIAFRAILGMQIVATSEGHVEQDADAIWSASCQVIKACIEQVGADAIAGIGITNQRETVLLWDRKSGQPVTPAVVWQCQRSSDRCNQLVLDGMEPLIQSHTGLRVNPLASATKVEWLLDNTEGLRARAEAGELFLGTVDSWLIFKLTAGRVHATDSSNASRTQLFNLATRNWDEEMLQLFRIPSIMLASIVESSGLIAEMADVDGLPGGLPIASAIGDSHAALAGHGIFFPGPIKATYGTGSSLMTLWQDASAADGVLAKTVAWTCNGKLQLALEGNVTMTGASVKWIGEFLQSSTPVQTALALADSVSDSAGLYLVPAMNGLGAPYWDSEALGAIYGLTRTSTVAHLARAALESIAHQVTDVFEAMNPGQPYNMKSVLYADGGASKNSELMQLQADLLGRPVERSSCPELSALGAAWFAGLAVGTWSSFAELATLVPKRDIFEPRLDRTSRAAIREGWRLAVERTRLGVARKKAAKRSRS